MGIQPKKKKSDLLQEGPYEGVLEEVEYKPNAENPTKVFLGFKPDGSDHVVAKDYGANLSPGSPLRKDLETLNEGPLDENEVSGDYVIENKHVGQRCSFEIMHKSGSGGRPGMVVTLVRPPTTRGPEAALRGQGENPGNARRQPQTR